MYIVSAATGEPRVRAVSRDDNRARLETFEVLTGVFYIRVAGALRLFVCDWRSRECIVYYYILSYIVALNLPLWEKPVFLRESL